MLLYSSSSGVTGFDGLYFEIRATRWKIVVHLNLAITNTCKQNCCKRKVSVLRYGPLCVRERVSLSFGSLSVATFSFPGSHSG